MRLPAVAVVAALAALGQQSPPAAGPLVVIVDGDAPAADAADAARLRMALLERLDAGTSATYLELSADRLVPVPRAEAAEFRRTVFTVTPPTYSGIAPTFTAGVEVLRGNEAVRDDLIARSCADAAGDCGARVAAAVTEHVRRTEASSAAKLRALVSAAAGWRGARVVLVTAGWPTRDDGRVALGRAVQTLRTRGIALTVVRVLPREPYRGLVRDAAERLAAELPAAFVTLATDSDVAPAIVAADGRAADTSLPAAGAEAPPVADEAATPAAALPAPPAAPAETSPAPGGPASPAPPDPAQALDATLRRAIAYVARFERTFTAVIWHERYEQEDRVWRRFSSSGASTSTVAGRRTLESELYFAWLPQDGTWVTARDVIAVDGKARPADDRRLAALAARGRVSVLELRDLARENGRFNIGGIVRTFNEPTLALLFLDDRHRPRVRFTRQGVRRADGRRVATYAFVEEGRPTLIRNDRRDVPARGGFAIDDATGEVLSTSIEVVDPAEGLTGRMDVDYRRHVAFDVLVPWEMRETYTAWRREDVQATAAYSDFRRFGTKGRLILTP